MPAKAGIQYAAAVVIELGQPWNTGSCAGDDRCKRGSKKAAVMITPSA
jgi:hypothetical protein